MVSREVLFVYFTWRQLDQVVWLAVARAREAAQAAAAQHAAVIGYPQGPVPPVAVAPIPQQQQQPPPQHVIGQHVRREQSNNEYAALFVALIGGPQLYAHDHPRSLKNGAVLLLLPESLHACLHACMGQPECFHGRSNQLHQRCSAWASSQKELSPVLEIMQ